MEDSWLTRAKQLQAIASTGLHFGASEFDKERYAAIRDIANAMLADLGNLPLQQIPDLFAHLFPTHGQSYATPMIDVRGAVVVQQKILLVQERSDGLWTLPGGYADVGLSAAENTAKEIQEEANIQVRVNRLLAVRHKAKHPYDADARDFYKMLFLCEALDPVQQPSPSMETAAAAYVDPRQLPPLSTGRIISSDIALAMRAAKDPTLATEFD